MDKIFQALAHTARREILDYVMANPGAQSNEIAERFEFTRVAVRKHIKILERCDLLVVEISGRHRLHYFNAMPIQSIYERWTTVYSRFFASRLNQFKDQLEQDEENDNSKKTA